jgi:hypothetical protein
MARSPKELAQQVANEVVNDALAATRQNVNTGTHYGSQTTTNITVRGESHAGDYVAGRVINGDVYGDQSSR